MRQDKNVQVIIPALNEELSIGAVLEAIPEWVDRVLVVDNGSTDRTAQKAAGAPRTQVLSEPRRGYGRACLAGIAAAEEADILVFLDGDRADYPEQMARLVDPVAAGQADLVLGSRALGRAERGSLLIQSRLGNRLAAALIRLFWGARFTDLGPFRAISRQSLERLGLCDTNYGWTAEMQVQAVRHGLRVLELPVDYRRRPGRSKVSGSLRGAVRAGWKILYTVFRFGLGDCLARLAGGEKERLIVYSRYPEPGRTKTRLIPRLGELGAARLQRRMTERMLALCRRLIEPPRRTVELARAGGSRVRMEAWLGRGIRYTEQNGGDLGARMAESFRRAFSDGVERAVLIGTDCPGIDRDVLLSAFEALETHDLVFGPAADGGYYLVGMRRHTPEVFWNIPWGTERVWELTRARCREKGWSLVELNCLADLDRPEDIGLWEQCSGEAAPTGEPPLITVIIPALNEADNLPRCLESLAGAAGLETILVDGGSVDGTREIALRAGIRVLESLPGRAEQQNLGAKSARGEYLLFLHADTRIPAGFERLVRRTLEGPGVAAGAFRLEIDSPWTGLRLIERTTYFRSTCFQMPYGDQGLFLRADTFHQLGGFPLLPVLEDFELVRRLRRRGCVATLDEPVVTSARRWHRRGFWRVTLLNQLAILAYAAGIDPSRIARWLDRG